MAVKSFVAKHSNGDTPFTFVDDPHFPHFLLKEGRKTKRMKGLTDVLKKTFYSNYSWKKAWKIGSNIRKKEDSMRKKMGIPQQDKLFEKTSKGGIKKGKKVHEQMQDTAKYGWSEYLKRNKETEPETMWLWAWMMKMGLSILASEVPVGFKDIGVATAIDMVCENDNKELVLVEWKTGMENSFHVSTGKMKGILGSYFDNSQMNQAQLQLHVSRLMFEETYGVKAKHSYVVCVNQYDTRHRTVDSKFELVSREILNQIKKTREKKPKKKKIK